MRRLCVVLLLSSALGRAQPVITSVLNSASSSEMISPGAWVSIYGTNLASAKAQASSVPLPKSLAGSSVTVGGKAAALNYVSPSQINALIPYEAPATGDQKLAVIVNAGQTASNAFSIYLNRNAPALFTRDANPIGRVDVFDAFFNPLDTFTAQQVVILYATGLGQTDPPVSTETAGTVSGRVVDEVEVFVGDQKAEVLYAGLAPGLPGIYQLNVRPQAFWTDRIYLRQRGWISNVAQISIVPGNNAINVSGAIHGTYPQADSIVEFSELLESAGFDVELDLAPAAKPFVVAVVSSAAGRYVRIDPVNKMYEAWTTGPTAAPAQGDFSQMQLPLLDIANGCSQLLNNIVPLARLDPRYLATVQMLGPATSVIPGDPTGIRESAWTLRSPTSFGDSDAFAGFVQIPCGSADTRDSIFRLYVDGKLIDSKTVTYRVAHR